MPLPEENSNNWKQRISEQYRLVILEEDTLREVRSMRLSLMNLYVLISTFAVIFGIGIVMLIIFTPLKTYIPGYGDVEGNPKFLELNTKLVELEEAVEDQSTYIEGLMNMLNGVKKDNNLPVTPVVLDQSDDHMHPEGHDHDHDHDHDHASESQNVAVEDILDLDLAAPIKGNISADFLINTKHYGVDVLGVKDALIKSIADGVVISSAWSLEFGNVIAIQHQADVISFYKHNSKLLKETGDRVSQGEGIAIIGNSGTLSDGPHLHFELWYKGKPLDPKEYINFN